MLALNQSLSPAKKAHQELLFVPFPALKQELEILLFEAKYQMGAKELIIAAFEFLERSGTTITGREHTSILSRGHFSLRSRSPTPHALEALELKVFPTIGK